MLKYYFFLPEGWKLGGVELWSVSMVRALNRACSGSAFIVSLRPIPVSNKDFPEDLRPFLFQLPVYLDFSEACSFSAVEDLNNLVSGNSVLIPNYSSYSYSIAAAVKIKAPASIKIIGCLHADVSHYYSIAKYFSPFIDLYICVSHEIYKTVETVLGIEGRRLVVRPCPIDIADVAQRDLFVVGGKLKIVYVGRLSFYQKRIGDLVELASLLVRSGLDFTIDIIGDGDDRRKLETMIAGRGLTSKINLLGRMSSEEVVRHLSTAHVFFSSSDFEGSSIALLESLYLGCIPVVTGVSGVANFVESGKNGYIYNVGDVGMASQLILDILKMKPESLLSISQYNHRLAGPHRLSAYVAWFRGIEMSGVSSDFQAFFAKNLQKNWDYTWDPSWTNSSEQHPAIRLFNWVQKKWFARWVIEFARFIYRRFVA